MSGDDNKGQSMVIRGDASSTDSLKAKAVKAERALDAGLVVGSFATIGTVRLAIFCFGAGGGDRGSQVSLVQGLSCEFGGVDRSTSNKST